MDRIPFLHVTDSRQSVNENHVDVAKKACQLLRSSLFTSPGVIGSRTASSNLLKAFGESYRWAGQLKTHFSTQKEGRLPNMGGHIALPTTPAFLEVMNSFQLPFHNTVLRVEAELSSIDVPEMRLPATE